MCREGKGLVGWYVLGCVCCVLCVVRGYVDVVMWLCGFRVIGKNGINCRPWLYAALPFSEMDCRGYGSVNGIHVLTYSLGTKSLLRIKDLLAGGLG